MTMKEMKVCYYESEFILDSFIFSVSPARFLRWLTAIVEFIPWSRVCRLVTYCDLLLVSLKNFRMVDHYR